METRILREFVAFSRYLNFSKAARQLDMAQPTLSNHIAGLERELGFTLVQRGKSLRLTPAGKRFCASVERLLGALDDEIASCQDIARRRGGKLVFERPIHQGGMDREFQMILLTFQEAHPEIAVRKQVSHDLSIREALEQGAIDVAFLFNDTGDLFGTEFMERALFLPAPQRERGPYYLWVDASSPVARRDTVTPRDLDGCKFLIPSGIRYQSLENLAKVSSETYGTNVICSYWPGSYEECIMNIRPDEMMIVTKDDLSEPAYSLVGNRTLVQLEGLEELIKPSFVYLVDNDNPALETFIAFVEDELEPKTAETPAQGSVA